MFGTGPACALELEAERATRAMESNAQIVRCDALLGGDLCDVSVLQVDSPQHRGVFRPERRNQIVNTPADGGLELVVDKRFGGRFTFQAFSGTSGDVVVAVVVDERVAEQAVKPGDGALVISNSLGLLDAFDECSLQDVLSLVPRRHTRGEKTEKTPVVLDQHVEHIGRELRLGLAALWTHYADTTQHEHERHSLLMSNRVRFRCTACLTSVTDRIVVAGVVMMDGLVTMDAGFGQAAVDSVTVMIVDDAVAVDVGKVAGGRVGMMKTRQHMIEIGAIDATIVIDVHGEGRDRCVIGCASQETNGEKADH